MTASSTTIPYGCVSSHEARRTRRRSRWALLRKELVEARAALVAGLVIFIGVPLFLTAVYSAIAPRHELIPGFATTLWLAVGWLFSAVLGAQAVCRDFGRAPGEFLLARPVRPDEVMSAKLRVGCGLIALLCLAIGVIDLVLLAMSHTHNVFSSRVITDNVPWWLAGVGASLLTYWLATAAAAITRQTLSAVMLAALVLVLLVAGPLVSHWPMDVLERFGAWMNRYDSAKLATAIRYGTQNSYLSLEVALVLVAGLAAIDRLLLWIAIRRPLLRRPSLAALGGAALLVPLFALSFDEPLFRHLIVLVPVIIFAMAMLRAVALAASRAERGLRIGTRALAWTVALALLLVFVAALGEVGANVPIAGTYWWPAGAKEWNWPPLTIARDRIAAAGDGRPRSCFGRVALFDIATDGHVVQTAIVDGEPGNTPWTDFTPLFDESDRLYVIFACDPFSQPKPDTPPAELPRRPAAVELRPVDWQAHTFGPPIRLPLPAEIDPREAFGIHVLDPVLRGSDLDLLIMYSSSGVHSGCTQYLFARYTLTNGTLVLKSAERRGEIPNSYIAFTGQRPASIRQLREVLRASVGSTIVDPNLLPPLPAGEQPDVVPGSGELDMGPNEFVRADRKGLYIGRNFKYQVPTATRPFAVEGLVGQVRASPWALLFRSEYPQLFSPGRGMVWEIHETSAICYDVSDPTRPRRIAHVTSYLIRNAIAGPKFLLLDHGAGFSLVRNPR